MKMQKRRDSDLLMSVLMGISTFALFIRVSNGGELSSECESLINFAKAIDPQNILRINSNWLVPHHCSCNWKGVKCNLSANTIIEIRLDNMNLSGIIDTDSLCKLPNLQVFSLAENHIRGSIPASISSCTSLRYLNISRNLLNGSIHVARANLKNLKRFDISKNQFTGNDQYFSRSLQFRALQEHRTKEEGKIVDEVLSPQSEGSQYNNPDTEHEKPVKNWSKYTSLTLVLGIAFFSLLAYFRQKKASKLGKEKEISTFLSLSPQRTPPKIVEEVKLEEKGSELVFFVEEDEKFKMEDLLEAAADLKSQSLCSSLYKVHLKNGGIYAVKRLKKTQVSSDEFVQMMRKVGNLKHQNILPLVAHNSTSEEKLLIYKYQRNGSLLTLFEKSIKGKRFFPWKLRLSMAVGIARGLNAIYQNSDDREIIPHGNIKLTNILLNENEEPQISEYGCTKFLDPVSYLFNLNGYIAPERSLTEQGDVFSFGVILLELLTGKVVASSGLDLPKWVKSVVREEWTGEVFDKEVAKVGMYAFPLLNISLKCVAHVAEHRPSIAEVLEKIEEVVGAQQDFSPSMPETWDTPLSNH